MRVFNVRLPESQYKLIENLAKEQSKTTSQMLREMITKGLQNLSENLPLSYMPQYEVLATSAAVETLILLRKIAENSLPELVDIAKQMAKDRLEQEDFSQLIPLIGQ